MSLQYDEYLKEHIQNVTNGLRWIADNLDLKKLGIFESDIYAALEDAEAHDRSKFDPVEYRAYDDYFYGGNKSYAVKTAFDQAWLHHQHVNPHHWQYWVLINDDDGMKALPMPEDYILEMIADWWSFSWREGNLMEIFDWYEKHRNVILFEEGTRKTVEKILNEMRKVLEMQQKHENGYVGDAEGDHLEHHGILGQKWGQRNGPPYPLKERDHSKNEQKLQGLQNLNDAKTANMEKWGNDPDHNVLYIAGYSGSGKSTAALALEKPGDSVIHLDVYTEPDNADDNSGYQDKEFNKYLDKHVPNWTALQNATKDGEGVYKRHSKEYWKVVDQFDKAIDSFSKEKYKNGERVIVEGVQIADNWLKGANEDYTGKPMAILQNGPIKSMSRAFERDDRGNLFQGLKSLDDAKEYAGWYYQMTKNLNGLADATGAKKKAYSFDDEFSHSEIDDVHLEHHRVTHQDSEPIGNVIGVVETENGLEVTVEHSEPEDDEDLYGVPELKKFPMPDKKHVKSAIRFFNWVDPKYEKKLAEAILEKMDEYGMSFDDFGVGDENRFKKYIPEEYLEKSEEKSK